MAEGFFTIPELCKLLGAGDAKVRHAVSKVEVGEERETSTGRDDSAYSKKLAARNPSCDDGRSATKASSTLRQTTVKADRLNEKGGPPSVKQRAA